MAENVSTNSMKGLRGILEVNLTEEQSNKYNEILKSQYYFPKYPFTHFDFFLIPEQIHSYHCNNCDKEYSTPPKVTVNIPNIKVRDGDVGVIYLCNTCNEHLINFYLKLEELGKIPEEFIEFDATGDYKKPTPESIDDLFKKIEAQAESGSGCGLNHPGYLRDLEIMLRWAEKIGYSLDGEKLKGLEETYRASYLREFQKSLPEMVESILDQDYAFSITNEDGVSFSRYEGAGLSDNVPLLLEALPFLTIDDLNLRIGLVRILNLHNKMFSEEVKRLTREKEEVITKLEERITSCQRDLEESDQIRTGFLTKYGLTQESIEEHEVALYPILPSSGINETSDLDNNLPF